MRMCEATSVNFTNTTSIIVRPIYIEYVRRALLNAVLRIVTDLIFVELEGSLQFDARSQLLAFLAPSASITVFM
jgi:hypothetical protein